MKTNVIRTMTVLLVTPVLAAATGAVAQDNRDQQPRDQRQMQQDRQDQRQDKRAMRDHAPHFVTLEVMKGFDVLGISEEPLGEIRDAVLNCRSGKVEYVLLEHGGTLGIGETTTAIPYAAFQFSRTQDGTVELRIPISESDLDNVPEFDRDGWPSANHQSWDDELEKAWKGLIDTFDDDDDWDRTDRNLPVRDDERGADRTPRAQDRDMQTQNRTTNRTARFCLASDLVNATVLGAGVRGTADDDSGHIDGLFVECTTGQLAFVSVDPDEAFADIGEVNRIVPFETIEIRNDGKVRLDVTAELMRSGVESPDNADDLDRPETRRRIYSHYGVSEREFAKPDWNRRGAKRDSDVGWGSDVRQALKSGQAWDFSGRIVRVREDASMSDRLGNMAVVVQTDAGERTIHIGPSEQCKAKLNLRTGQQVQGKAIRATLNGQTVHVLRSITVDGKTHELRTASGQPTWSAR